MNAFIKFPGEDAGVAETKTVNSPSSSYVLLSKNSIKHSGWKRLQVNGDAHVLCN